MRRPSESETLELVPRATERGHPVHQHEARPEDRGLLVGLLGEPTPADTPGEPKVIADARARPGLPTDAALVHHEGAEPLGRGVHGRGQARRPCAHDDDVVEMLLEVHPGASSLRDLGVGGVAQGPPIGEDHQRKLRLGARPGEEPASLVRVGRPEGVRDRAALENLPQLVGSPRPLRIDDVDGVRNHAPLRRPFEQQARDGLVEHLILRGSGSGDVILDLPQRHRVEDRLGGRLVRPGARRNHEATLGVRMDLPRTLE